MNTIGQHVRFTSYGESHGSEIGGILDGIPAGYSLDIDAIQEQLNRRRPGQSEITTERKESDRIEITSGLFEGRTTGAPIHFRILNRDARPSDYRALEHVYRPSHADFTYSEKYGIRDHRGGGRSSARVTASWVAAGAMAEQILATFGIEVVAFVDRVGKVEWAVDASQELSLNRKQVDAFAVRCPDSEAAEKMIGEIERAKADKDSLGGSIVCVIQGVPPGLGDPVFSKLNAALAHSMMSINAVKALEIGGGFEMTRKRGSEVNDEFVSKGNQISTRTNNSGGIQGGISNGQQIFLRVGFKPTATIGTPQNTVNASGDEITMQASGRHDPCVLPRAVPIVEAMASLPVLDALLINKTSKV